MITGTYIGSAVVTAGLAVLLINGSLTTWWFFLLVSLTFFVASAEASSAYLTVSEVFPMGTRALSIWLAFAIGTAVGGITFPLLFGHLIHSGDADLVAIGFLVGAAAMALSGHPEVFFGVRAEQQSLENTARPLTAEETQAAWRNEPAASAGPPSTHATAGRAGAVVVPRTAGPAVRPMAGSSPVRAHRGVSSRVPPSLPETSWSGLAPHSQ
ncbi:hypothetical protein ACFYPZ_16330 [Streptomyces sp. NPDC005506]|uniref:hypothetical protein n=1 Tax=unclassified Streptomyces TaxID=2593676 RepID=UPI0036890E8C